MEKSKLSAIIRRLNAMVEGAEADAQTRYFEKNGKETCEVTYLPEKDLFEMVESGSKEVFQFDDIDMVAMEIYELIAD